MPDRFLNWTRISISQILAGCVAVCAAFAMAGLASNEDVVWRQSPLGYKRPRIPPEYHDNGRNAPLLTIGLSGWEQFESGPTMFRKLHRRGWKSCRSDFYFNRPNGTWSYETDRATSLSKSKWNEDHFDLAYRRGYADCRSQINLLLSSFAEEELRSRLCYSKKWFWDSLSCLLVLSTLSIPLLKPRANRRPN